MNGVIDRLYQKDEQLFPQKAPHSGNKEKFTDRFWVWKIWERGFEPPTSCTPCKRASQAALHPEGGQLYDSGRILVNMGISLKKKIV